jgi:acyl-CoA thioester hydrolase
MKPAPERLLLKTYPFVCTLNTRLADADVQRHLNNAVIAEIYEDARARMHLEAEHHHFLSGLARMVAARLDMNYVGEGVVLEDVQIGCGVASIGRTSHVIGQGMFQRGVCIGTADAVLVYCDDKGPATMPEDLKTNLETLLLRI